MFLPLFPLNMLKQAARAFDVLEATLLKRVADRDRRPRWNEASCFKPFAEWGKTSCNQSSFQVACPRLMV
jgi:hypothetical protein